jgi:F0F1-type ATP synthase membrane subunit b/b'
MSKAVIAFCHGLETTLLGIEERLGKATRSLAASAGNVEAETKKHVEEASALLAAFRAKAAATATSLREEIPEQAEHLQSRLAGFGAEAQTAMRHALVVMAEAAAKGATNAADVLKSGADEAHDFAGRVRDKTVPTAPNPAGNEILPT